MTMSDILVVAHPFRDHCCLSLDAQTGWQKHHPIQSRLLQLLLTLMQMALVPEQPVEQGFASHWHYRTTVSSFVASTAYGHQLHRRYRRHRQRHRRGWNRLDGWEMGLGSEMRVVASGGPKMISGCCCYGSLPRLGR